MVSYFSGGGLMAYETAFRTELECAWTELSLQLKMTMIWRGLVWEWSEAVGKVQSMADDEGSDLGMLKAGNQTSGSSKLSSPAAGFHDTLATAKLGPSWGCPEPGFAGHAMRNVRCRQPEK